MEVSEWPIYLIVISETHRKASVRHFLQYIRHYLSALPDFLAVVGSAVFLTILNVHVHEPKPLVLKPFHPVR